MFYLNLDPAGSNLWEENKLFDPFGSESVIIIMVIVYYFEKQIKVNKSKSKHINTLNNQE